MIVTSETSSGFIDFKVSVAMITFNHEHFIAQAIESVLMQQTDFDYELVIAEDCSTDGTRAIVQAYKDRYPSRIRLLLPEQNQGMNANFVATLNACRGKYIAILEGDDYWIDPLKLQKQVIFLERNPEFVGCFHNTEERYEESIKASTLYCSFKHAMSISFKDLSYANLIPTCSVILVKKYIINLPQWFSKMPMGDWPLHLINAQFGDYWYIPHVMGVHRLTTTSTWALQDQKRNIQFVLDAYNLMITGFSHKLELAELLKKGKKKFILTHKPHWYIKNYRFIKKLLIEMFNVN
ncbi:MAG: glycosyltransferase [Mariniphaga sp.]